MRSMSCGHPKETAWHPDNEGWFEVVEEITCHGCTALVNARRSMIVRRAECLTFVQWKAHTLPRRVKCLHFQPIRPRS